MRPHSPRRPTGRKPTGRIPWVRLAQGTIMRRAPRQPDPANGDAATHARFASASVNAELVLVTALQPGTADVIADARSAPVDGAAQHSGDGAAQPIRLDGRGHAPQLSRRQL